MAAVSAIRNALMAGVSLAGMGVSNDGAASSTDAGLDVNFAKSPVLPGAFTPSFTGLATRVDQDGTWKYRPHNFVRNSACVGAVAGSPGTLPTNWGNSIVDAGLTFQVLGTGAENGIPYVEIRVSGAAVGATNSIAFDTTTGVAPALTGQFWNASMYLRLTAGSWANISNPRLVVAQINGGGSTLIEHAVVNNTLATAAPLNTQRYSGTDTFDQATVAWARSRWYFTTVVGAVDFTLRIGLPQLEQKLAASDTAPSGQIITTGAVSYGPRWDYDPATVDATVPHNLILSSDGHGGTRGVVNGGAATGTNPTFWAVIFNPGNLLVTYNGQGTDQDGKYNEYRVSGTWGGANPTVQLSAVRPTDVAALLGQQFWFTYAAKVTSLTGQLGSVIAQLNEQNGAGSFLGSASAPVPSWAVGQLVTPIVSKTMVQPGVAFCSGIVSFTGTLGQATDFTVRIYRQQQNFQAVTPYIETFGAAVPASFASKALRIEPLASTNQSRNNTMVGAVAGTPGTLPTGWGGIGGPTGVTTSVVGTGVENGIPYIDLRWSGTATSSSECSVSPDNGTFIAAANGQTWAASSFARIVAGSLTNMTAPGVQLIERDAGGAILAATNQPSTFNASQLSQARVVALRTFNQATTAFCNMKPFRADVVNGAVIDVTVRIGFQQLEQLGAASYPIPTYGAAVTRPADYLDLAVANIPGWNPNQGYIALDWHNTDLAAITGNLRLVSSDGTNTLVPLYAAPDTGSTILFNDGGFVSGQGNPGKVTIGALNKAIAAWDATGRAVALNNGSGPSGSIGKTASVTLADFASITKFTLGTDPTRANSQIGFNVRRLRIGGTRPMNDLAIQALVA